ncbi:hypothetical protein GCM10027193_11550 [Arenimonas aestuarii]
MPVASGQAGGGRGDNDGSSTSAGAAVIELRVCNRSGKDALVAISYLPVEQSRFYNRGWFRVNDGECKSLVETGNSNFYFYADVVGGNRRWAGSHSLCVEYPGPYNFYSDGSDYCGEHQEARNFVAASKSEPGTFTWNLDP